jgi:peptide/nickel transport system permease protein
MALFVIRRLLLAVIIVILVTALVFVAMRLMPGDPILFYVAQEQMTFITQEQIEQIRHEYGLDKPIIVQYADWVNKSLHGDLGYSITNRKTVADLLQSTLPVTLYLGLISFILGNILGIASGIICAVSRGKVIDLLVTVLANIGITIPVFWLGIIMIYVFSLKLGILPTYGFTWPTDDFWLSIRKTIMPVICLAVGTISGMARQTRSVMLEVIRQDYVRTARAKGLSENLIIMRHVMKNGFIPLATLAGIGIARILGGSVIIESVFNISGMGRLAVDSIMSLDYPVTQAIVLISAIIIVLSNLVVDLSYGWLDPRVRYS